MHTKLQIDSEIRLQAVMTNDYIVLRFNHSEIVYVKVQSATIDALDHD